MNQSVENVIPSALGVGERRRSLTMKYKKEMGMGGVEKVFFPATLSDLFSPGYTTMLYIRVVQLFWLHGLDLDHRASHRPDKPPPEVK